MSDKQVSGEIASQDQHSSKGTVVSEVPSAVAPLLFFDRAAYFAYNPGAGGSLTLTAERITADPAGMAKRENVIVPTYARQWPRFGSYATASTPSRSLRPSTRRRWPR